jgi:flagellar basal body rod protein FlgB
MVFLANKTVCQQTNIPMDTYVESILFDDTFNHLTKSIVNASRKQSIYAYNTANLSTPEFLPVLTPDEQRELNNLIPENDPEYAKAVTTEFILAKMTDNRLRHSAYISLQKKKIEIIRQVSTLGKK